MIVLVPLILVILQLVAKHPLFLVMMKTHVLLMDAALTLAVPTLMLIVKTIITVRLILAILHVDVNMKSMNVNTEMLVIL